MKIKGFFRIHKKRKIVIITVSLLLCLTVIGIAIFLFVGKKQGRDFFGSQNDFFSGMNMEAGMVGASGITSVGVTQEKFEVEGLTQGLLVEEVYVSSGQEIKQGDKILKVSEESVETAREELEKVLREADLAYRAGAIEYEQNKITIAYEKDMAVLEGKQAQEIYDETIASLSSSMENAREELSDTKEQIAEYRELVDGDDYYNKFKVGEYKALYDENLSLLKTKMEEWGATWAQVTSGAGGGFNSGSQNGGGDMGSMPFALTKTATSDQLMVLRSLYNVLEQNLTDYEQAQADYEDAVANARLTLQTLELSVSSLEKTLLQTESEYESRLLQAKLTLEQSLSEAENAQRDYETAMEKAELDYENLKGAKEDAETNLELFESSVGDGYYYAAQSGSLLRVSARKGQYLGSESTLFMYTNPAEMTVTVSVDQADIADIRVGGEVYIESSEYGSFRGSVSSINPVSSSDSRTNVTYNVTVMFTESPEKLGTNETVTVIFTVGGSVNEENEKEN